MLKEYLVSHIKHNKNTSISIIAISILTSLLLSVLSGILYNLYADEIARGTNHSTQAIIMYFFIIFSASFSIILMIHNVFSSSMSSRLHQLGILKSVGATPKQIKAILIGEVIILSIIPIIIGTILGIGGTYLVMQVIIHSTELSRDFAIIIRYSPLAYFIAFLISFITVLVSSWIPARKISKISVLETIFYKENNKTKRIKKFRFFSKLFGVEGEIARKSIYARKKSFRTASLSFICSSLALISFLNFETISGISTKNTFFERYRDKWDIMLVMDESENRTELIKQLRNTDGIKSCMGYKKYSFYAELDESLVSDEVKKLGGLEVISDKLCKNENGKYVIDIPIIALDNESFIEYYNSIKNNSNNQELLEQCIAINKIYYSKNKSLDGNYINYVSEQDDLTIKLFKDKELKNRE